MGNDKRELIRRFAVAIAGAQSVKTFDDRMSEQEIWRQAKFMVDVEPPADDQTQQPENTQEDWWELQGNVTRLTKDVERLSGTVKTLRAHIRVATRLVKETRHELECGYAVSEETVDKAIQILEEQE